MQSLNYPKFSVIDKKTGEYPDVRRIARHSNWARNLCHVDAKGFALTEEGQLIMIDSCGSMAYCPPGRFVVIWNSSDGNYHQSGGSV